MSYILLLGNWGSAKLNNLLQVPQVGNGRGQFHLDPLDPFHGFSLNYQVYAHTVLQGALGDTHMLLQEKNVTIFLESN